MGVDAGDGITNLVPVTEGYLQPMLIEKTSLAGQHVTQQLMKLMVGQGQPLNLRTDTEQVRQMKEKLCYIAYDVEVVKELIFETIRRSDVHMQKDLFAHIVLSGGTTMFPGLSSRLERDLRQMFLDRVLQGDRSRYHKFPIRVEDPPRRQHSVFLGSSILAAALEQEVDSSWWITRSEYSDRGAEAVHRLIPTRLG